MGRYPTKAADNMFCKARMEAAKYNEKLRSKEGAAEMLGVSASTLSDYELGLTKNVPPDMVIKMADLYNAPELQNFYCTEMCPLGCDMPKTEIENLDRLTIRALSSFRKLEESKEILLDITEDGRIDDGEKDLMADVLDNLKEISCIAENLKIWAKKNL